MKRMMVLVVVLGVFLPILVRSQDRGLGLGVIVGDPTGLSAKIWTTQNHALQFTLAWRTRDPFLGTRVGFSADYVWHSFNAIESTQRFPVFYGVGGALASGGAIESALGIRGVLGIAWLPRNAPIDVFIQVVPVLVLTSSTDVEVGAAAGFRFFFG